MRIETLREFLCLAEALNFSETARRFFITQSTLSRHIMDLEKELDCELFLRNKQSVRLTTMGSLLIKRAQELVALHDSILEEIERAQAHKEAVLNIGYLFGSCNEFLDGCYKLFKRECPETTIFARSLQPDVILERLKNDTLDIGITLWPKDASSPVFEVTPLYRDEFVIMVERSNKLAKLDEVSTQDLIVPIGIPEHFPHEENLNAFLRTGLEQANVPFKSVPYIDDIDSIPLLFQERSTAIVTCGHLASHYGSRFKYLPFKDVDLSFDVCLLWKQARQKKIHGTFAECLRYSYDIYNASTQ